MPTESLERGRELLERLWVLHAGARRVIREHGLEPGAVREVPEGDRYVLAFGYRERTHGGGVRQRYAEVLVSGEEYVRMDDEVRSRVLEDLGQALPEGPQ